MRVRQTELVAPFLALKLPLIIMGEGVEMGLGQDKAGERTETDLGTQDPLDPSPDEPRRGETLPAAQDSRVPPESPPLPPTGRVKPGWGPFSQFKQLPLITPLTEGRGSGGGREMRRGGASGTET